MKILRCERFFFILGSSFNVGPTFEYSHTSLYEVACYHTEASNNQFWSFLSVNMRFLILGYMGPTYRSSLVNLHKVTVFNQFH
jgi:hypothetical protein